MSYPYKGILLACPLQPGALKFYHRITCPTTRERVKSTLFNVFQIRKASFFSCFCLPTVNIFAQLFYSPPVEPGVYSHALKAPKKELTYIYKSAQNILTVLISTAEITHNKSGNYIQLPTGARCNNRYFFIKKYSLSDVGIVIRVSPIFTLRRQGTIFDTTVLNLRVREKRSPKSPAFWRKDE